MERIFDKLNRYFRQKWRLAVLDLDIGRWVVEPDKANIAYLKAENANGRHILIQPDSAVGSYYLLVDDVDWALIWRQHKTFRGIWKQGRMVVETSKDNYQVWIHSSRKLSLDEKQYWLKKLNSDPGAHPNNRWGRCPGFRNRKEKHRDAANGYPLSRLLWLDWRRRAAIPEGPCPKKTPPNFSSRFRHESLCKPRQISRTDYGRGDESATDFAYAIAMFRRGYPASIVRRRILSERSNWKNHSGPKKLEHYIERTIERAQAVVVCI